MVFTILRGQASYDISEAGVNRWDGLDAHRTIGLYHLAIGAGGSIVEGRPALPANDVAAAADVVAVRDQVVAALGASTAHQFGRRAIETGVEHGADALDGGGGGHFYGCVHFELLRTILLGFVWAGGRQRSGYVSIVSQGAPRES